MSLANCKECGRLFQKQHDPICPSCKRQEEADFLEVTEYLRHNLGASTEEIAEATEVEVATIVRWIREGRLQTVEGSRLLVECQDCGTMIRTGQYCESCKKKRQSTLEQLHHRVESSKTAQQPAYFMEDRFRRK